TPTTGTPTTGTPTTGTPTTGTGTAERATSGERAARLDVSPSVFVAGQLLTFSGRMPTSGVQNIRLQFHMGRPGDSWTDVERGRVGRTSRTGAFSFTFPAPAMLNVRWRVRSSSGTTPGVLMQARWQEILLEVDGGSDRVATGSTFTVVADTAPDIFQGPPPIPGRTVVLQQRVRGDEWRTVARDLVGSAGLARFQVTAPSRARTVAYRAVQRDWNEDGDRIGWFPSYPHLVDVVSSGAASRDDADSSTDVSTAAAEPSARATNAATPTASTRYRWAPSLFDFAWESGESLTSRPARGTRRQGGWLDTSDGTGRASKHNGGVELDTGWDNRGDAYGSHGTTTLTLSRNAQTYGRWEFRMRSQVEESGPGSQHTILVELVPATAGTACSATAITVAKVTATGGRLTVGSSSARAGKAWTWTKRGVSRGTSPHNFAVEVGRDHVTWFYDGSPIATTKNRRAVPGVPLTPRISMVGVGQRRAPRTQAIYDWVRGFPIDHGTQVRRGHALRTRTLGTRC
ncbi:hypothetical protein, partial [Nocardioides bruguierae]